MPRIAPTEVDPWRQRHLRGEVHDENAFALGGVSAHAGLFSTGQRPRQARTHVPRGRRRLCEERRGSTKSSSSLRVARDDRPLHDGAGLRRCRIAPWAGRRLTAPTRRVTSCRAARSGTPGSRARRSGLTRNGAIFVVLLSNRVNPTREHRAITGVRVAVADAVMRRSSGNGGTEPCSSQQRQMLAPQRVTRLVGQPRLSLSFDQYVSVRLFEEMDVSTTQQPEVAVVVTAGATTEVMRFMEAEGVSPDVGGLRVSVQPGGCSGFKYGLLIEDQPAEDDLVVQQDGFKRVRRPVLGAVPEQRHHRLRVVDAGFGLHVQEPERHRRLRLRSFVHGLNACPMSVVGSRRSSRRRLGSGARDSAEDRGPLSFPDAPASARRRASASDRSSYEDHDELGAAGGASHRRAHPRAERGGRSRRCSGWRPARRRSASIAN